MAKNIFKRAGLLMDMHDIVTRCCEDEDHIEYWLANGCPDGMDMNEAVDIAESMDDEDYIYNMELFIRMVWRALRTSSFTPCDLR